MYAEYKGRVQFFIIYIKEAHPADAWAMEVNPRTKYIKDPATLLERFQVATSCVTDLKLSIPCLVDDMENSTADAYKGWPDRLYVIGKDGRVAFQGRPGPAGFRPEELERALKAELAKIGVN
jgi:hypothetical protein